MSEDFNVAVIGGGVVGCWTALELSKEHSDIVLFEKNPGITRGENQSSRNSGVLHAGIYYDTETRPLKAQLCVEGNRIWYEFCADHQLACLKTGKLIASCNDSQESMIVELARRASINGVPEVKIIDGVHARRLEPNVHCKSALLVPSSGIIDPIAAVYKVYALASNAGVLFMTGTKVFPVGRENSRIKLLIRYRDGAQDTVLCRKLVNAAGVDAIDAAKRLDPGFPIKPALVRGDSMKFYRTKRPELFLRGMNVYPVPTVVDTPTGSQHTVGVHLTPTLDITQDGFAVGNTVTVGPKLVPVDHTQDYNTPSPRPAEFLSGLQFFPALKEADIEPHQCGIQARLDGYPDFHIGYAANCRNAVNLVGIDSPGLTAAPAIAKRVARMLREK
jgi:L-2-hydroxyglutarate oxidase LhgO